MVKLQSSEMFIKDPVDVWNKEHTIGNAELAVRLGSPATFDRRGTVLIYDDFNDSPLKWTASGFGTATLSNEKPLGGGGCMKFVTPTAADANERALRYIGGLAQGKVGAEIAMYRDDEVTTLTGLVLRMYTGTRLVIAGVSIQNTGSGGLKYLHGADPTLAANWTTFDDTFTVITDVYYPFKFVVDLDAEKYVRCMFCGEEIDMSSYTPYAAVATNAQLISCDVVSISVGVVTPKTYFDKFILTIEEPE